jgi:hypothetical protein
VEDAFTSKPPHRRHVRGLRRAGTVLIWTVAVVLGAFGLYFSLANYPWFGVAVVLLILALVGYSERERRATRRARSVARARNRLRP